MAAIPGTAVATAATTSLATTAASFIVNVGASYLLGRLTARDGPRLGNLEAAEGNYGAAMPRVYGENVRLAGIFIVQDDILETKHTVNDHSTIVGAVTGAASGFMIGGPVGAAIGAVAGGLLGFAAPKQHYYTYSDTLALLLADRTDDDPIEGVTKLWANGKLLFTGSQSSAVSQSLDANGKLIFRKYGKNKYFKSLTVYGGNTAQGVDPILAEIVDEDGAYPYSAYIVIEKLQLAQFGNSVPPIEALVSVKTGQKLAQAAEAICFAAGIENTLEMSSTALVSNTMRGYAVTTESTCWDALKPLLPVFGVDCAEVAGQIRFYRRFQALRATIPPDDMGAYVYGDDPPQRLQFSRNTDLKLPQETALTFIDPARDYQPNTMTSRRSEGSAQSNITTSIQVVMTADEGATAAALMHWDAWLGRTSVNFSLTDAWNGIEPGVAYAIRFADQYVPYRIKVKTRGANGITEIEAVSDESVTYTAAEAGDSGTIPPEEDTTFPETRLVLMDMPILEDAHDDYGFYVVMAGEALHWIRAEIQASSGGVDYATLIDSSFSAIVGDVTGTLAAGSTDGLDDTLDTTSVLTVELLHSGMTLESATDAELDAFKNFAFVGKDGIGEYLQFKTATFVSGTAWDLTDLRRGRRGTDWALTEHVSGEDFALLGGEGVFRIVYSDEIDWGNGMFFRGVSLYDDPEDATVVPFTNTGEGKRPYSPVNVHGSWDGSHNLTITWDYRSRMNSGALGIDDRDEYEVEILNATPVRTIIATAVESVTYSAANQATDGLTPSDSIIGRVRQTSDVNDGRWRDFSINSPIAVGITSETDTALALASSSIGAASMATETDAALALSPLPSVNQFETLGNSYSVVGAGAASPAGLLIPITPTQTCDISSVVFGLSASTGQSAKALVYTDSAGAPNTLIAAGTATSLGTVSTPTPFNLPFSSPVTLTGGTTYWIGFVPSGSITYVDVNLSPLGSAAWSASVTYAAPEASLSGIAALGTGKPVLFVAGAFSAALSGTDLVATSEYIFHGNTSSATWVNIPKFAVGDVVLLQLLPTNGGPPSLTTAPAGFTLVSSKNLNNVNFNGINFLYARIIDGTENGIVACKASSYNNMNARLTVWRGMDVSGTPYESVVTSFGSGTSVVSPAITTTGPDRLALNFFGAGAANNTDLTGVADTWTDVYDVNTTVGTDAALSCTYQDAPTASTLSTETRTNAAGSSTYAVIGLALIRA